MSGDKLIQEFNSKRFLESGKNDRIIMEFKDSETRFDGDKKARFKQKGELKNALNAVVYEYLEGYNIPTHFAGKAGDSRLLVRPLKMIPVSVLVRNIAAGSFCEKFKVEEGLALQFPVIEYYLNTDDFDNLLIVESHAYAFGYATPDEMKHISRLSFKINAVLKAFFERRKLKLVDFKLEFGRFQNKIFLADEISPDTARIWQIGEDGQLNKKYFHFENSKARESYQELCAGFTGEKI